MSTSKIVVAAAALSIGAVVAVEAASSPAAESLRRASASDCSSALPPALGAPEGNALAFGLVAEGVQIYACARAPGASDPAWTLQAPEAALADERGRPAGTHGAGPTWRALDGSAVVGAKVEAVPSPDATSVPWLLLRAKSHAGTGRMADVTFVQRIGTSGGVAPAGGCSGSTVGALAQVPYRAVYCFYRPSGARP